MLNDRNEVFSFGKLSHGRLGIGNQTKNQHQKGITADASSSSEGVDYMSEP